MRDIPIFGVAISTVTGLVKVGQRLGCVWPMKRSSRDNVMARTAEIKFRRMKIRLGEYEDLMTDEVWFLREQVDHLIGIFREEFMGAERILDVGAGTCWFAAFMKQKHGKDVLSLDVSKESMDLSKELYEFEGQKIVGEVSDLTALDMRFDLICCSALLHHIENLSEFYLQISDLLEPGGLFVAFNEPRSPHSLPFKYLHRLWFGRSPRAHGVQELPRTLSEYLDPVPVTLYPCVWLDYAKSQRNYEQIIGKGAGMMYSLIANAPFLRFMETNFLPEAIILALRRHMADDSSVSTRQSSVSFNSHEVLRKVAPRVGQ